MPNTTLMTEQERAVLGLLVSGATYEQIGQAQHLSRRTVRRVVDALKAQFDADSLCALGFQVAVHGVLADMSSAVEHRDGS